MDTATQLLPLNQYTFKTPIILFVRFILFCQNYDAKDFLNWKEKEYWRRNPEKFLFLDKYIIFW